jgi:hypothetical protein
MSRGFTRRAGRGGAASRANRARDESRADGRERPRFWRCRRREVVAQWTQGPCPQRFRFQIQRRVATASNRHLKPPFWRVHQTLRATPAMEAGLIDHVWSVEEIVGLLN